MHVLGEPWSAGSPVLGRGRRAHRGPRLPAAPHGSAEPRGLLGRHRAPARGRPLRRGARRRRARRRQSTGRSRLQPWHAAAARHRAGDARAARAAPARRADQRARPAPDPRDARRPEPLCGHRPHRRRVEPPARRGRADLQPRRGHAPGRVVLSARSPSWWRARTSPWSVLDGGDPRAAAALLLRLPGVAGRRRWTADGRVHARRPAPLRAGDGPRRAGWAAVPPSTGGATSRRSSWS